MAKMKAVQIAKKGGPLELVEKDIPEPKNDQVRVKIKACGICHSDVITKDGLFPSIKYPIVPGHEIAGVVDKVGSDVKNWKPGQRVGIGWFGGNCGYCSSCRKGDFITCQVSPLTPGVSYDGGYAEYVVVPANALALIPDDLDFVDAGPLMCAGITTYNALRNSGARAGDVVAVLGVGGLGHLAVQFAAKMGFKTVAIARGKDKEELAKKLGAQIYIDSEKENPGNALQKLGGARVILATVTNGDAMSAAIGGLGVNGKFVVLGATKEPIQIPTLPLLAGRKSVTGWPSGTSMDSQDTMNFCSLCGIRSMNEVYPLEKAAEAFDRMLSGKAKFRVVLKVE